MVKNIVVKVVHKIGPESTAMEAAAAMVEKGIGCLIVSGEQGPIGMVTERDLLAKIAAVRADSSGVQVKDIMSVPLITVSMNTTIGEAAQTMIEHHIRRLVVTGEDGIILGLVTMTDIVRWVAKQEELSDSLIRYLMFDVP